MGSPVPVGTVVLSFKLSIGKVGITGVPMFTNEAIAALPIKDKEALSKEFLYWSLKTIDLTGETDDAAMGKTLNKRKLSRLQIPLPPKQEQQKIVDALNKADSLRERRRTAIDGLTNLSISVFREMFEKPRSDWPTLTVEEVASPSRGSIRTGPFGSQLLHGEFVDAGIAVLGIDNAVHNEFRWAGRRYITEDKYATLSRYTVFPGDVLITIMGTCGRCAVVPDGIPRAINTKHLCCITLDRTKCLPEYLHSYFLWHPDARHYLERAAKGAIMTGLNMSIIKSLSILLPPVPLQDEYVTRMAGIRDLKSGHKIHLKGLEELFHSLQYRAFHGEL